MLVMLQPYTQPPITADDNNIVYLNTLTQLDVLNNDPGVTKEHKAYRMHVSGTGGGSGISARELAFVHNNVEIQTNPGTSFGFSGTNTPVSEPNAFDGDLLNVYNVPGSTPLYVGKIFDTPITFDTVRTTSSNNVNTGSYPRDYILQYSDDTTNGLDGTWFSFLVVTNSFEFATNQVINRPVSVPYPINYTLTITTPPSFGTAVVAGNYINYTPNNGYLGPDSFQYDVNNSGTPATVTFEVVERPLSLFKLDDAPATNNLAQDSIGTAIGQRRGGVTPVQSPSPADPTGTSFDFSGNTGASNSDIVTINSSSFDWNLTQPFSIIASINPDISQFQYIISRLFTEGWSFFINATNEIGFVLRDTNLDRLFITTNTTPVPINSWSRVAVTYDGSLDASGVKFYIDGTPILTNTTIENDLTLSNVGGSIQPQIGGASVTINSGHFDGKIDHIKVYNKEISAASVLQEYNL